MMIESIISKIALKHLNGGGPHRLLSFARFFIRLAVLTFSLSIFPLSVFAGDEQIQDYRELVDFSAVFEPTEARPGENIRLVVKVDLKKGWHIYSVLPPKKETDPKPTTLEVEPADFIKDGPVYETRPVFEYVKSLDYTLIYHDGEARLYQNLILPADFSPGDLSARVKITYQPCTDSICLPAEVRTLDVPLRIEAGPPRPERLIAVRGIDDVPGESKDNLSGMLAEGVWAFIGLAALMGLVSLLTPCVFPMIPITISFFSKQAEGKQSRVIKLAGLFALGIIGTYTGMGLLTSILFGAGGALLAASNPYVNLAIAGAFIIFAFSLMGAFEITLPQGISAYFDQKSRSAGGVVGVLLMGFTFTLTAFTCTVQFVGTMLIAAAQGEWIWPLLGMLVFSSVFAFPFFLLAVAPSLIKKMQGKSGAWLGRSKVVLGVLELMASVKFLSNADLVWQTDLLSRNAAILIWVLMLAGIVGYLTWTGIRPRLNKSPAQWTVVAIFVGLIFLLGRGLDDRSLGGLIDAVLPPPSGLHVSAADFVSEAESKEFEWLDSLDKAVQTASDKKRLIFLEFTGYTCVNCRWMEQNVLARKDVHHRLAADYVPVRLFTDGGEKAAENVILQIDQFNTVALPFYVILSPDGKPLKQFSGISRDPGEFLDFLAL
jgi:thiol:disulfide interchange protein